MNIDNGKEAEKYDIVVFENMNKKIKKQEIEAFLDSKNLKYKEIVFLDVEDNKFHDVQVTLEYDSYSLSALEALKSNIFPGHKNQIINIRFVFSKKEIFHEKPIEDEEISYMYMYNKMIKTDFDKILNSGGLIFKNKDVIDKQRAVVGYLIKKVGMNILTGKSIMNVSLPINIFDIRSHLEVYVYQNSFNIFLEKAAQTNDKLERLKLSTTFILSTVHLAVAQLKPFNPILGETFQAKIGNSYYYVEQTSNHPPIFNFFVKGNSFKIYGHNISDVSTGANSLVAKYNGKYVIEYMDGVKHYVSFPEFKLSGMLLGNRTIKYKGNLTVVDLDNDIIAQIIMDPDERGFFKKIFTKKGTYPDYFSGIITNISTNTKYSDNTYHIKDLNKYIISNIEGEFSDFITFDNVTYWEYNQYEFPIMRRMNFTLPSDSTFREDIFMLKKGDEDEAQRSKIKLEEIQRNDRKLRLKNK